MSHAPYPTAHPQSTDQVGQSVPSPESQNWRLRNTYKLKPTLDDDSLLNVFYFCRPALLDEDETDDTQILRGGKWNRERWWYELAHVCRRWRYLVLGSASHLSLSLLCTYGTPVADMLAHSPPLPLVLNYIDEDHKPTTGDGQGLGPLHGDCQCIRKVTTEDEKGILLALQHRDRVRCIRFLMPVPNLQKVAMAIDDAFPLLEYLYLEPLIKRDASLSVMLQVPKTLQAPHLRHLVLKKLSFPIGSRLLTTAKGLVTLSLQNIHPSAHFPPDDLLQLLSVMPQLETLGITFDSILINRHLETMQRSNGSPITLPNLRWFGFRGTTPYLEALLPRIITPLLDKLQISLFDRWMVSSHLWEFMSGAENLRFSTTSLTFSTEDVRVMVYPHVGARTYSFYLELGSTRLERQVAFAVQIFNALKTLYAVEYLTLKSERPTSRTSSWSRGTGMDPVRWRELLRSFSNVKTLRVPHGLVRDLSRSLESDSGETHTELLPELEELLIVYSGSAHDGDEFTAFVDTRQDAGRPVKITREIV